MSLLVVGSIAFDSVETPTERRDNILGGSAVHFSYAASFFTKLQMVGVVGEDWPDEHTKFLQARGIDTSGIRTVPGGKTFRWTGKYLPNMNDRETLEVHLNVLESFQAELSPEQRASKFVYLGNDSPQNQMRVLEQVDDPQLVVADTMDLWINIHNDELKALLKKIDGMVLNDSEAKLLVDDENVIRAGGRILELGPKFVVIKKGEHGALFFSREQQFVLPAYPTPTVVDPTGAGDSFAGGMMGYLAEQQKSDAQTLKEALAYGSVVASYNVEDFSLDRMRQIDRKQIDERFTQLRQMLSF